MRGVSPVVAVVLLIAITVIAAMGTWYWVSTYTSRPAATSYSAYLAAESCDFTSITLRNNGLTLQDKTNIPIYDISNNTQIGTVDLLNVTAGSAVKIFPRITSTNVSDGFYYFIGTDIPKTTFTCIRSNKAALSLDGIDDNVNFTVPIDFAREGFSVSLWFKWFGYSDGVASETFMIGNSHGTSSGNMEIIVDPGNFVRFRAFTTSGPVFTLSTNTLYHVVATMNASGYMNLYLNGVAISPVSGSVSGNLTIGNVYVGQFRADSLYSCNCTIDDFILYNRTLNGSEVNNTYANNPPANGMLVYQKYDWGTSDSSGNGYNGLLNNGGAYTRDHTLG